MSDKKFPYKISESEPTAWFDDLYNDANESGAGVPWANMDTHPLFLKWLDQNKLDGTGKKALVVGCGMGDDAITLEQMGFEVTAFDVSEKAIEFCQKRFQDSKVQFVTADLLKGIPEWSRQFDFVLEIYTIQALPPKYEAEVIHQITDFVTPNGRLLVIANCKNFPRNFEHGPPWMLNSDHVTAIERHGFSIKNQVILKDTFNNKPMESYITEFVRR